MRPTSEPTDRQTPAAVVDAALAAADTAFVVDFRELIARPWPADAAIRAGTALAAMPMRPVPGQRAISARHMPRPASGGHAASGEHAASGAAR